VPRVCTICKHPKRDEIDKALISGESLRGIARRFKVDDSSLDRHKSDHLAQRLLKAEEVKEKLSAKALLEQLESLHARTLTTLDKAERGKDKANTLKAIHQARENLKLMAQIVGELPVEGTINVHLSAQWLELRATIITALLPHPEARHAVLKALGESSAKE
jgi:transcriptional regulator of acetoin/glycerol metabolism